ncbi:hypothetical protein [Streptomyces sp. NPDC049916]
MDHSRAAGRVRGITCFNRNPAVGELGNDPDVPCAGPSHTWRETRGSQHS